MAEANADLVLKGLDAEIARLNDDRRAPGWTNWAVMAGIGTLLWGLAGILDRVHFSRATGQLVVALSLGFDAVTGVPSLFKPRKYDRSPRYRRIRDASFVGVPGLVTSLRAVALIWAAHRLSGTFWSPFFLAVLLAYGWMVPLLLMAVIAAMVDAPIPLTSGKKPKRWELLFAIAVILIGAFAALYIGVRSVGDWRAGLLAQDDLRFAGAVVSVFYLVTLIAVETGSPVVEALMVTRRDLAFGRIDVGTAVQQADIAIMGMRFSEFLQEDLAKHLGLMDMARLESNQVLQKVGSLAEVIPPSGPLSESQLALAKSVLSACATHQQRSGELIGELANSLKFFLAKIRRGPADEQRIIADRLAEGIRSIQQHSTLALEHYNSLVRRVSEAKELGPGGSS